VLCLCVWCDVCVCGEGERRVWCVCACWFWCACAGMCVVSVCMCACLCAEPLILWSLVFLWTSTWSTWSDPFEVLFGFGLCVGLCVGLSDVGGCTTGVFLRERCDRSHYETIILLLSKNGTDTQTQSQTYTQYTVTDIHTQYSYSTCIMTLFCLLGSMLWITRWSPSRTSSTSTKQCLHTRTDFL